MRTHSVRDIKTVASQVPGFVPSSRKLVFSWFEKLSHGRLLIMDNGIASGFGQLVNNAQVTGRIIINDPRAYQMVLHNGVLGAAEAYMEGYWDTPDLLSVIRVMAMNINQTAAMDGHKRWLQKMFLGLHGRFHKNSLAGSKRNIVAHYDLGNEFFSLFLDRTMMYSSAIFKPGVSCLEQAASHKLDVICQKLDLRPGQHVLEIGTGWGGFACHAALNFGCQVTSTTISREQYLFARKRVAELGIEGQVNILLEDYRELSGQYDRLVSIEMIEAVGHDYYADYFSRCGALLKPNGKMLIQSILVSDQRYDAARRNMDFIKRYIFPGGCLPSVAVISDHVARYTDMQIVTVDDISYDYTKTLACWRERFLQQLPQVRAQGFSDTFIRMWDFYLCYCQAGFMERTIHTDHIMMAGPQWRDSRYPC